MELPITKSEALRIAEKYYNSNIPILGGDVYLFNNGNIKPTFDNWYCIGITLKLV